MENLKSCISKEPFTKLEKDGVASVLNYNLPHSTCYDATCFIGLDIKEKLIKDVQKNEPKFDYWNFIAQKSKEEITTMLDFNQPLYTGIPLVIEYKQNMSPAKQKSKVGKVSNSIIADSIMEGFMPIYSQRFSGITDIKRVVFFMSAEVLA